MNLCPFNGCGNKVRDEMFACSSHWFLLSRKEKDMIWAAYRDYREGAISSDEMRQQQQTVIGKRGRV